MLEMCHCEKPTFTEVLKAYSENHKEITHFREILENIFDIYYLQVKMQLDYHTYQMTETYKYLPTERN